MAGNARMDDPAQIVELAQERLQVYSRIRCLITEKDGPRATETIDTYCKQWTATLSDARRRLSEDSE